MVHNFLIVLKSFMNTFFHKIIKRHKIEATEARPLGVAMEQALKQGQIRIRVPRRAF
jgi:hypothetical protein